MDDVVTRVRGDMPGVPEHIHINSAGASPMPRPVLLKMTQILQREQLIGGYAAAAEYAPELEHTRSACAQLIGASAAEIALVDSATTAWVRAFYSIRLRPGDILLTCEAEYAANYVAMLQQCKRHSAQLVCVPSDSFGLVDLEQLDRIASDSNGKVAAICITHVPTNGGVVNPAVQIGAIARKHNAIYLLDACQSVGQQVIDVRLIGCDFLSATGRKYLRAPRGTGFLYVRSGVCSDPRVGEPVTIDHSAAPWVALRQYELLETAQRYEQWESNFAGLVALGVAVDYALGLGLGWIQSRVQMLGLELRERLRDIGALVHDLGPAEQQCGIVSFSLPGVDPAAIKQHMIQKRIYVTLSNRNSTLLDATRRALPEHVVRASVHYFNISAELDALVSELLVVKEQHARTAKL